MHGTPDEVIERIQRYEAELGISGLVLEMNFGGQIPNELVLNSIRQLTEKVMPEFKLRSARRTMSTDPYVTPHRHCGTRHTSFLIASKHSVHNQATVHIKCLACDVPRAWARQENRHFGYVLWLVCSAYGYVGVSLFL